MTDFMGMEVKIFTLLRSDWHFLPNFTVKWSKILYADMADSFIHSDSFTKHQQFVPTAQHEWSCMQTADQTALTLSVVHQHLFLINPGDPGLLAASPQHFQLCLHTLISLVSVQNVPRMVISPSMCLSVPSFIFPSLCHKSQRSSWNRWEKLGDQSRPTPEQTDWANGPAAFSSPQIISGARECSQSGPGVNAKAC